MTGSGEEPQMEAILQCSDRGEAYYRLVALFLHGPDEVRDRIREGWDFRAQWVYPDSRRLACSINESHSSRERALASLAYYAIDEKRRSDRRDDLVDLAIIYHACIAGGLDPVEVFEEVASVSSPATAGFFMDFVNRRLEDRSMAAFMLVAEKTPDGEIEIRPSWWTK